MPLSACIKVIGSRDDETFQFIEFDELRKTDLETTGKQHFVFRAFRTVNGNENDDGICTIQSGVGGWATMPTPTPPTRFVSSFARTDFICVTFECNFSFVCDFDTKTFRRPTPSHPNSWIRVRLFAFHFASLSLAPFASFTLFFVVCENNNFILSKYCYAFDFVIDGMRSGYGRSIYIFSRVCEFWYSSLKLLLHTEREIEIYAERTRHCQQSAFGIPFFLRVQRTSVWWKWGR